MSSPADLYYAAACQVDQPNSLRREEMAANTSRMLAMIERAVIGYRPFHDVRLVVFPEFAHAAPVYETAEELLEKLAVPIPNEHTERLAKKARELGVYIQSGSFLEVDARWPDAVFNTTCLIGPTGIMSRYRKVNPWIPWEVHASPHDIPNYPDDPFPVIETELGRLGVATCYDWIFPEVTRELALKGAEVLIRISAYMDPWGATAPTEWWSLINRVRALENVACVVACNQGASAEHYPPFSWPGGSMIVDLDGRVLAEASPGPGARIVVGPIQLGVLRAERARRVGHAMPAQLRSEIYRAQRAPGYPASPERNDRTVQQHERRIAAAKRRLYRDRLS
ncbi:MAG: nitrilase-related carbon-nitrogen hydrolase [Planctomycetota bacterium]